MYLNKFLGYWIGGWHEIEIMQSRFLYYVIFVLFARFNYMLLNIFFCFCFFFVDLFFILFIFFDLFFYFSFYIFFFNFFFQLFASFLLKICKLDVRKMIVKCLFVTELTSKKQSILVIQGLILIVSLLCNFAFSIF